jgi:hypothetical protein
VFEINRRDPLEVAKTNIFIFASKSKIPEQGLNPND